MYDTYDIERLRDYANLFSSQTCERAIRYGDTYEIKKIYQKFDSDIQIHNKISYWDYLDYVYKILCTFYRNEYVYKNEVINKLLIKKYSLSKTVAINEFKVGKSIADLTMFNGSSKVFEIKSDLDSSRRLSSQISNYTRLFEKCFIVIPYDLIESYKSIVDDSIGIISLRRARNGRLCLNEEREAISNYDIDVNILMSSVRATEYKWMVQQEYGALPNVNDFEMFDACKDMLTRLSNIRLKELFLEAVKKRSTATRILKQIHPSSRQMCLSMSYNTKKIDKLISMYDSPITL